MLHHGHPFKYQQPLVVCAGRDKVELLLAMGATRMEATREVVQRAARMALTPLLNVSAAAVGQWPCGAGTGGSTWAQGLSHDEPCSVHPLAPPPRRR